MKSPRSFEGQILAVVISLIAAICSPPIDATAASDPGTMCATSKQKAAAKKLTEKVKCHGTAIKKGIAVDPTCLSKAETKFEASFAKAEAKGGCVTEGDVGDVEALIDETLASLLAALPYEASATTSTTTTTSSTTTTMPPVCAVETSNCDGLAANGCECSGDLCCGGDCQPPHVNGLGQSFDGCEPLGVPGNASTYSESMAEAAKNAWPEVGSDNIGVCGAALCLTRTTSTSCAAWCYTSSSAGYVKLTAGTTCVCPTVASPQWQ